MFDFSSVQYNSEYPGLQLALFTAIFSVVLGVLLAYTYEKTSRDVNKPNHFLQAIVLVTIVASMIIQAIGDSVARGLGMLGALSIIRFRTTVRDPRNIVFMFSAIAIGIACGVFGFVFALVGTIVFSMTAFALYYSSFSNSKNLGGTLRIEFDKSTGVKLKLNEILDDYCEKYLIIHQEVGGKKGLNFITYNYDIKLKKENTEDQFVENLDALEGVLVKKFVLEIKSAGNI